MHQTQVLPISLELESDYLTQDIHLWDLDAQRIVRRYTGQRQGKHIIRSCFGGVEENFIVSGSEGKALAVRMMKLLILALQMDESTFGIENEVCFL
jgi:hypothetical protein